MRGIRRVTSEPFCRKEGMMSLLMTVPSPAPPRPAPPVPPVAEDSHTVEVASLYDTGSGRRGKCVNFVCLFPQNGDVTCASSWPGSIGQVCPVCLESRGMRISRPHSYRAAAWSHHALMASNAKHEVSSLWREFTGGACWTVWNFRSTPSWGLRDWKRLIHVTPLR